MYTYNGHRSKLIVNLLGNKTDTTCRDNQLELVDVHVRLTLRLTFIMSNIHM